MYENEKALIEALCESRQPDTNRIKSLLEGQIDLAYVLGKLVYSGKCKEANDTLVTTNLGRIAGREFRNSLKNLTT